MATMAERRKATDDRIYKAAVIEFGKNGYANTTLANIAKESGITPGLIVQNFGSKESLYRRIALNIVDYIMNGLANFSSNWEERANSIVSYSIRMLDENPDAIHYLRFYVSLITSLDTPDEVLNELFDAYKRSPVERIISEGQKRGELIDGDPYAIHSLFWSNMYNTLCFCYNNKLEYPKNEWFLQVMRSR